MSAEDQIRAEGFSSTSPDRTARGSPIEQAALLNNLASYARDAGDRGAGAVTIAKLARGRGVVGLVGMAINCIRMRNRSLRSSLRHQARRYYRHHEERLMEIAATAPVGVEVASKKDGRPAFGRPL